MRQEERSRIENQLQGIPAGQLTIICHSVSSKSSTLLTEQFSAATEGKGKTESYTIYPGIEASYNTFFASEVTFHHESSSTIMELFHCRGGRIGWNMQGGTAVYLGAGDLTAHSTVCCAESAMMFPLGYAEGISFSVDLHRLEEECPEILKEADVDLQRLQTVFCSGKPISLPACPELEGIFAPLYSVRSGLRMPYLKLKSQELLLYLSSFKITPQKQTQYFSQQTELIKEIHRLLTEHLDQRFTIEYLSRRYSINTSTLKEVFKGVYGLPIARYMKEFRVREAMKLLRETNDSIASIAKQVGYETQGKFTKAFKDVTQTLPTVYRKNLEIQQRDKRNSSED